MSKLFYHAVLAALLLVGAEAVAKPVAAKITVGTRTWDGLIISRNADLSTVSQGGVAGNVSYPADAIKNIEFPVEVDPDSVSKMMQNRSYEQLIVTLEEALKPFEAYSDLPSNLIQYQSVLMELNYKIGNFDQSLLYSAMLARDNRDPVLQRKSIVYQALALLEAGRFEEAQSVFDAQGWTTDLPEDAPAEDIYITAKFMFMKKEYEKAMETVAKVIAFNSQDPDWMQPSELLCAQIYAGMAEERNEPLYLDSADEVIREITLLYKDSDEAEEALVLKRKIDDLRSAMGAERQ